MRAKDKNKSTSDSSPECSNCEDDSSEADEEEFKDMVDMEERNS